MGQVFVTTYEVIGGGIAIADDFYASVDAARKAHWDFVTSVGGEGFRPAHYGSIRSVLFKGDAPDGWKKIGTDKGNTEATPRKASKVGRAFADAIKALPHMPKAEKLVGALGYNPSEMAMDTNTGTIYFPTETRLSHPARRIFVRIPRFANDGFEPDPAMLCALPESEFMKAIEDHNAEAKRLSEADTAKAAA